MAIAQEIIGEVVQDQAAESKARIPVDNLNLSWVYAHFPMAWEFKDGRWLPELSQIGFRKGLNGQPEDGSTAAPKAHVIAKGGTVIEQGNARLGPYKNYLRRFPAFNSQSKQIGTYYASMFEKPTVIGGRFARWTLDTKGFDNFRAYLVDKGLIEALDATVVAAKIEEKQGLIDHLKNLPATPQRSERIVVLEKLVAEMVKSLDAYESHEVAFELEEDELSPDVETALDDLLGEATPKVSAPRRKPGKRS